MTLTVRLDDTLETALERYCAAAGVTKSLVVQESLAAYLLARQPQANSATATATPRPLSGNYRAFEEAGLIGGVAIGLGADKAAVRDRIAHNFAERKARQSGK